MALSLSGNPNCFQRKLIGPSFKRSLSQPARPAAGVSCCRIVTSDHVVLNYCVYLGRGPVPPPASGRVCASGFGSDCGLPGSAAHYPAVC